MNYSEYIELKKRTGDIKPFFSKFDSSKHKISKFKLILIMPDGECLFMPYSDNDKRNRIQEMYTHKDYLLHALSITLDRLGIKEKDFIEIYLDNNIEAASLVYVFFAYLGISILYDIGLDNDRTRYINFEKSKEFSEEQRKTVLLMRKALEKEKYKVAAFEKEGSDKSVYIPKELNMKFNPSKNGEFIGYNPFKLNFSEEGRPLKITEFYEIIKSLELDKNPKEGLFTISFFQTYFGNNKKDRVGPNKTELNK